MVSESVIADLLIQIAEVGANAAGEPGHPLLAQRQRARPKVGVTQADLHSLHKVLVLVRGDLAQVEVELLRDAGAQVAILAAQVRTRDDDPIHAAGVHLPDQHVVGIEVDHGVRVDRDVPEDAAHLRRRARASGGPAAGTAARPSCRTACPATARRRPRRRARSRPSSSCSRAAASARDARPARGSPRGSCRRRSSSSTVGCALDRRHGCGPRRTVPSRRRDSAPTAAALLRAAAPSGSAARSRLTKINPQNTSARAPNSDSFDLSRHGMVRFSGAPTSVPSRW